MWTERIRLVFCVIFSLLQIGILCLIILLRILKAHRLKWDIDKFRKQSNVRYPSWEYIIYRNILILIWGYLLWRIPMQHCHNQASTLSGLSLSYKIMMTSKLSTTESSRISYSSNVKWINATQEDKNLSRLLSTKKNYDGILPNNVHLHSSNPLENATVAFIAS